MVVGCVYGHNVSEEAVATLRAMNDPATTTVRSDGYIQDEASQLVAPAVGAARKAITDVSTLSGQRGEQPIDPGLACLPDDPALRANRIALLRELHTAMNRVADLSKLAT